MSTANSMTGISSFSMVYAQLFFKTMLASASEPNDVQEEEGTLKIMAFLIKGIDRLLENDVKRESFTFRAVFDALKQFVLESHFFLENEDLFDDYVVTFAKYFLYYLEEEMTDNMATVKATSQTGTLMRQVNDTINKLSFVYREHLDKHVSEENKATKEIEQGYILLQIYYNNGSQFKDHGTPVSDAVFKSKIVCIDILLSETLKFIRSLEKSDQILLIMHKFILFRCLPYMSKVTQNKIINTFNDFSHPGGPFFAPR